MLIDVYVIAKTSWRCMVFDTSARVSLAVHGSELQHRYAPAECRLRFVGSGSWIMHYSCAAETLGFWNPSSSVKRV